MTVLGWAGVACLVVLIVARVRRTCLFGHKETIWAQGRLQCMACGRPVEVLPQATVRGPKHDPDQVRGIPNIWAKTVRKDNVIQGEWKRSER